jgi:hypothetical protein
VAKYGTVRQATDDSIIGRMRFVCWIPKATDTHREYVTLIVLSLQQWFYERTPILRYVYIGSRVTSCFQELILRLCNGR